MHIRRCLSVGVVVAFGLAGLSREARAQEQPFMFTVATPSASKETPVVRYEIGLGRHDFVTGVEDGVEQQVSIQADLARGVRLLAGLGLSVDEQTPGDGYSGRSSQEAELLVNVLHTGSGRMNLALGGGILHEYTGTDVLRARIAVGDDFARSRLHANVLFEKPLAAEGRDEVDLLTSIGWLARLTDTVHAGVEAIGEDLEGFWDEDEAEGGARLLIGPSVYLQPPGRHWRVGVSGGPVIHATHSTRDSGAPRDLPNGGFAVRTSFGYLF